MNVTPQFDESTMVAQYLPEILDIEARAILHELVVVPPLTLSLLAFDAAKTHSAIEYVKGVLDSCYQLGHLKVAVIHEAGTLFGYGLVFVLPDSDIPHYLHKLYVKEEYRRQGLGRIILKALMNDERGINLITPPDNIEFYQSQGLTVFGPFEMAQGAGFTLSRDLYQGVYLMGNKKHPSGAPVFLLNDEDIRRILG